jgi:hypothetical protein
LETPSGVATRKACTPCGTVGAIVTSAVTSNFFALSSIGASVRTTPLAITGFSTGTSFTDVMLVVKPGSLKMNRVAPPMFVPSTVTVTRVPRCPPVRLAF